METMEGDQRLLPVVSGPRHLSERPGLVLPCRVDEVRHGLPGNELVASSRSAGNHRTPEYFRWYLGKDAKHGMDVRAANRVPGRRGRSDNRTAQGPSAAL